MIKWLDVPFLDVSGPHGLCFYAYTLKWNDGFYLPQFTWIVCAVKYWCCLTSKQIRLQGHFHGDPLILYTFLVHYLFIVFRFVSSTNSTLYSLYDNEITQLSAMGMPHHHRFIIKWLIKLHCLEESSNKAKGWSNFCPCKHKRLSGKWFSSSDNHAPYSIKLSYTKRRFIFQPLLSEER